jgi:hypothetical protein
MAAVVPVAGAHGTPRVGVPSAWRVPHHLIDDPSRDTAVFKPGGEGVPKVMRPGEVEVTESGSGRSLLVCPPQVAHGYGGSLARLTAEAAAWAGEDQGSRIVLGRHLAADRLKHGVGERHDPDAGIALGTRLVPVAELARLEAGVKDLDAPYLPM